MNHEEPVLSGREDGVIADNSSPDEALTVDMEVENPIELPVQGMMSTRLVHTLLL